MRVAAAKIEHEADPDQRSGAADDFHRDQREVALRGGWKRSRPALGNAADQIDLLYGKRFTPVFNPMLLAIPACRFNRSAAPRVRFNSVARLFVERA